MSEDPVVQAVYAEFAEHAIPEAFERPTRAHRVALEPTDVRRDPSQAAACFGAWVDARIADALAATWPHDRPLVVVYTSDGRVLRRYDENGCGHLRCVTGVVSDELAAVDEPWVFGADLPRPQPYRELVTDADGNEGCKRARICCSARSMSCGRGWWPPWELQRRSSYSVSSAFAGLAFQTS